MSPIEYYPPSLRFVVFMGVDRIRKSLKNRGGTAKCDNCEFIADDSLPPVLEAVSRHHSSNPDHNIVVVEDCCKFGA